MSMFTDQQQSTTSLYLSTINHIYLFLLRCGDYESALSFHPRAPTECSSAHDGVLSAYYDYRTGNRGDILLINNQQLNDSITALPIRKVGGWNAPSCPSKFRAAVKAQHDAINHHPRRRRMSFILLSPSANRRLTYSSSFSGVL